MGKSELTKAELLELVADLESKLSRSGKGRKSEVLELLRGGYDSIESISEELGINSKNVSSVLSGLRKDGYMIISYRVRGSNIVQLVDEGGEIKING